MFPPASSADSLQCPQILRLMADADCLAFAVAAAYHALIRQEKPYFGHAGCFLARRLLDQMIGAGREIRSILSGWQKDRQA